MVPETFPDYGISFSRPAAWRATQYVERSSFTDVITYLSDQPLHSPCTSHKVSGGTQVDCGWPVDRLEPGHVLIMWRGEGFLVQAGRGPKVSTTIGGHPARLDHETRRGLCTSIGATAEINAVIGREGEVAKTLDGNNISMYACFNDKDRAVVEPLVEQMLASVHFTG